MASKYATKHIYRDKYKHGEDWIEILVTYTYSKGALGFFDKSKDWGGWEPAEEPKLEICTIEHEMVQSFGTTAQVHRWNNIKDPDLYSKIKDWLLINRLEHLIKEAARTDQDCE